MSAECKKNDVEPLPSEEDKELLAEPASSSASAES